MFRSLRIPNYRWWFAGALVSNVGAWMQRTAQDWIVLTDLTDHDAAALGVTMALQFGPLLVLSPFAGLLADRIDRKRLLMLTQASAGLLALGLGLLLVTDLANLWIVYAFSLGLGVVTAIDGPVRQAFVSELVPNSDLPNAVALNATSFQSARLIGPAVAGVLVALIGAGPVFLVNAVTFGGVLLALRFIRRESMRHAPRLQRGRGQIREGFRYVRSRPDIVVVLSMVFLVGTFGFNFPIFVSTMATIEFGKGATEFGLLSSIMAVGAVVGSLLAARREKMRVRVVSWASAAFGIACLLAAFAPDLWTFAVALILVGAASLTMMNTANSYVQTTTNPAVRGRVMALYLAIFAGGTPIGAPIVGWAANEFGPRWGLGVAALSGVLGAGIALGWMIFSRNLRVGRADTWWRLRLRYDTPDRAAATQELAIVEATARRGS